MCGIVGYTGNESARELLIRGLYRLEYRGYDSAGIALQTEDELFMKKVKGKIANLEQALEGYRSDSTTGIGHTRWATHGVPSEANAHPHFSEDRRIMLVHNGIIENYKELRESFGDGVTFTSETDTEVLVHMLSKEYDGSLEEALRACLKRVEGSYAVVAMHRDEPDRLVAARSGSPLILGKGVQGTFATSDLPAMLEFTREVIFLDEDELAVIEPDDVRVTDFNGRSRKKAITEINWDVTQAEKSGYKHFMLKEIMEQPQVMKDAMRGRIGDDGMVTLSELPLDEEDVQRFEKITLIACGTSYHACLTARYWLEEFTDLRVEVDIASEYRYRTHRPVDNELLVAVSQSGETADTLAALREARERDLTTVAVNNVVGNTMSRESDGVLYCHAGPEIGVASTKAFSTQLVVLFLFSLYLGQVRGNHPSRKPLLDELQAIPDKVESCLQGIQLYEDLAQELFKVDDFLYLGRHLNYPMALEGALKLKEISYIHAEGYPAGEMKHGPIALIDDQIPIVALAPNSRVRDKMISNIEEAKARGGRVLGVGEESDGDLADLSDHLLPIPGTEEVLTPLLTMVPMQLLAYTIADRRGCDVDQPRNLAKSVTVE